MKEQQEFSAIGLPMEVQDAMRNQLPQMMNKLLRDELAKGERAIQEVQTLTKDIKRVEKILDELGTITAERRILKKETEELRGLQKKVEYEQKQLSLNKMQHELLVANKYGDKLEGILAGLVRNVEWRKNVLNTDTKNMSGGSDGSYSESRMPTETSEEAK